MVAVTHLGTCGDLGGLCRLPTTSPAVIFT